MWTFLLLLLLANAVFNGAASDVVFIAEVVVFGVANDVCVVAAVV